MFDTPQPSSSHLASEAQPHSTLLYKTTTDWPLSSISESLFYNHQTQPGQIYYKLHLHNVAHLHHVRTPVQADLRLLARNPSFAFQHALSRRSGTQHDLLLPPQPVPGEALHGQRPQRRWRAHVKISLKLLVAWPQVDEL